VKIARTLACVAPLLSVAVFGLAQEAKKPADKPAPAAEMMPMPKPGPEHELLKKEVGTWEATVEMMAPTPGASSTTSKGTETSRMVGGLWLVTEFKGDMMNQPFEGHGVAGYDPNKKKYVSTWVDSMSTGLSAGESTYDAAAKTMTGWMEGPNPDGTMGKMKMVTKYEDDDTRVFTMSMVGPDGKEAPAMKITYKRRK
jgi:Protein of unknown function (DUF1579)